MEKESELIKIKLDFIIKKLAEISEILEPFRFMINKDQKISYENGKVVVFKEDGSSISNES